MRFYLPDTTEDVITSQLEHLRGTGGRAMSRLIYLHEGNRFELKIGAPRKEFRRETGPRGGYRKNAQPSSYGREVGGKVLLIVNDGHLIYVTAVPGGGWGLNSIVGVHEVLESEYFDEFIAPASGSD